MQVIGYNKNRMSKKRYKRLQREMSFHAAYGIDLSDEVIGNIFRAKRPKVILDNIKMAGNKLELGNKGIVFRSNYRLELAMNYVFGYFGLFVIAVGGLILYFQNDWHGLVIFLLYVIGGLFLVIPVSRDLARYRAAKKVIAAYNDSMQRR